MSEWEFAIAGVEFAEVELVGRRLEGARGSQPEGGRWSPAARYFYFLIDCKLLHFKYLSNFIIVFTISPFSGN